MIVNDVTSVANQHVLETASSSLRWCEENPEEVMLTRFVNGLPKAKQFLTASM